MSEKQNNLSETFAAREEKPENAQNEEVVCGISDREGDEKSMEETSVTEQSEISAEPHEKQDKKLGKKFVGFLSENALLIALCGVMLCSCLSGPSQVSLVWSTHLWRFSIPPASVH